MPASTDAAALSLLSSRVRDVPDYPKPGILFKDITPLLADAQALRTTIDLLQARVAPLQPTCIVAIESRGFLFGVPLAERLGIGFAPVRKPGKLPYRSLREEYTLEYGSGALEMHEDAVGGQRVVIVDDLLATGGTAAAAARLCERQGATVLGFAFVIELCFLHGRALLGPKPMEALLAY
jgi:adenine phosphoribosyltransferase